MNQFTFNPKNPKLYEFNCIRCGQKYNSLTDRGLMRCRFHPKPFNGDQDGDNYGRLHYDCCGATTYQNDFAHWERDSPFGCVRADHVATEQEIKAFMAKPYFCVSAKGAEDLTVVSLYKDSGDMQRIVSIDRMEDMKKVVDFKLYPDRVIRLDLESLRRQIHNTVVPLSFVSPGKSSAVVYTYHKEGYKDIGDEKFEPFYIIRRVDWKQDDAKLREVTSHKKECIFSTRN